jgi:acyl-CoA synthetase (AMP-forming)/AMP-acid ligase II
VRNNVGLLLSKRAALSPRVEALVEVERGRRFTYAELNARCNRAADVFRGLGVRPGERVALLLMNGVEFVESFFALAKLGAIIVPLNWRLVPDELAFILKDSGARVLVYDAEFQSCVRDLHERGSDATAVRDWIHVGGDDTRDPFAASWTTLHERASEAEPEVRAADDDPLYIMYTSGTTGLPKGAVHTHRSVFWASFTIGMTADVRYRDRYVIVLPLFHVGALTPATGNVHRGMTTILMRAFDPVRLFETIAKERVTTLLAVPAMLNFMLQVPGQERWDTSTLRWIMSGAAPVPVTLIEAYAKRGIEIHQVYGLTESCGPACLISPEEAIAKAGSTGEGVLPHRRPRRGPGRARHPAGRERRGARARRARHAGLLEPARRDRRGHPRRLALHRRPRDGRRRRLRLHPGPEEGHDHLRRREHLSRRDRERDPLAPAGPRRRRDRAGERQVG